MPLQTVSNVKMEFLMKKTNILYILTLAFTSLQAAPLHDAILEGNIAQVKELIA